jgi:PBP1b-binding outer membrane lipoprotein LpoB
MKKILLLVTLAAFVAVGCSSTNPNDANSVTPVHPMPANNPPSPDNPPNGAPVP